MITMQIKTGKVKIDENEIVPELMPDGRLLYDEKKTARSAQDEGRLKVIDDPEGKTIGLNGLVYYD